MIADIRGVFTILISLALFLLTCSNYQSKIISEKKVYSVEFEYGGKIQLIMDGNILNIFEKNNFIGPGNRVIKATYTMGNSIINIKPIFEYTYSTNTGIVRNAFINCEFKDKIEFSKEVIIYNGYKLMVDKTSIIAIPMIYPNNTEGLISIVKEDDLTVCENKN